MHRGLWIGSCAVVLSVGFVAACGDDEDPVTSTPTADGSTQRPGNDAATQTTVDAGVDGRAADSAAPAAPIVPQTLTRIPNAINPYGLTFASDGYLYISGATIDGADRKLAVWRAQNGVIDTSFGTQ